MSQDHDTSFTVGRREFLKTAGAGIAAAGAMTMPESAAAQALAEKARFDRIASCTWPIRQLFKTRPAVPSRAPAASSPPVAVPANRDRTTTAEMKQKYGKITMLDFPQWTKDTFPGVTRMD